MEIEGSDGSKTQLKPYSTTVFGRGNEFHPNDLAVSRRHISLQFNPCTNSSDTQTGPRVSFEVLGKNPVWVYSKNEDGKIGTFKRFQRGQLGIGDMFCLSAKDPVWFTVKEVEKEVVDERECKGGEIERRVNDELSQSLESSYGVKGNGDIGLDAVDVSSIDPVREFGFLVIGCEFDQYPKRMIRDVKNWDWFLEDPRRDSDEDAAEKGGRRGGQSGKRKKTKGDDDADEEWTGESEDEEVGTTNARKIQRPTYQTRSKDQDKPSRNRKSNTKTNAKREQEEEYEEEEDEEDETLGGFIVEDDTVEEEEDDDDEDKEEEEEEFVEDEDDLEN
uniref:FHA domain-containing protein n=2 Tax=Opuntia streptacantha TaxID=393608 RepID=A0A7C9DTC2_OPUST